MATANGLANVKKQQQQQQESQFWCTNSDVSTVKWQQQ